MSEQRSSVHIRVPVAIALIVLGLLASAAPAGAHPAWLAPANLSAPGRDATEPQVAVDGSGAVVAVWARFNGSDTIIQASARPAGGVWGPVVDLSQSGRDSKAPHVAVDPAGNTVAVWARFNGSHWVIQGASKPAGGGWTPARDISNSEKTAEEPDVAVDPAGRATAVWSRYDGFDNIVQSAQLAPGSGAWSQPVDLSEKGENAEEPQVAVDAAGDAVAVWSRLKGTDMIAQAAFRLAGGGWEGVEDLSEPGGDATEPQISVDPGGHAVAVWSRAVGGTETVEAADMAPTGWWLEAADLTGPGEDATEPGVAFAGGRALAVWSLAGPGSYSAIQSRERPNGDAWQQTKDLTTRGLTQTVVSPQVAIDPSGNAVAVWARSGASPTVIESRIKPTGAPWTGIDEVSELGSSANEAQVALGATGDGASIWSRDDGANTIAQAAGFDGAGPLFPSLAIPSAATERQPVDFGAATFDNWSPVTSISWSFGDGGEGASGSRVSHTFGGPGTYPISIIAADNLGNSRSAVGAITIYRLPNASRNVRVRRGVAFLVVHCPSPAGCTGVVRLIARVQLKRHGRSFGKRAQVGRTAFNVPGGTTRVRVRLTRPGRAAVQRGGKKGVRTQLTGPGIQHRLVLLLPARTRKR